MSDTNQEILLKLSAIDNLTPTMLKALQSMEQNSQRMAAALDQVGASSTNTAKNTEGLNGSMVTLASGFELIQGGIELVTQAWEFMEGTVDKAVEASIAAEQAQNQLTGALVSTGQYTETTDASLTEYAETLQKTTGASQETTKGIMATGIQMGLSTDKAEQLVLASQKLSAATGKDLNTSFQMIQQSLAGQTRGLAKVLPQIKDFGTAQLQQGAAIDLVNQSLDAQYQLYQGSFAAGLDKAKSSINEVYVQFGNLIIQNPAVQAGIQEFTDLMGDLADGIKAAGVWIKQNQDTIAAFAKGLGEAALIVGTVTAAYLAMTAILPFGVALWGALTTSVGLYGVAGTIAANATALLDAGLALLFSPITIAIAAVIALTAAFYKWPGLFDVLVGGIKALVGVAIIPLTAAMAALTIGIGAVVGVFNKSWGDAISNAGKALITMNTNLIANGAAQVSMGVASIEAGKSAVTATTAAADGHKAAMQAASDHNKEILALGKTYDGFTYGTFDQRKALTAQVQDRDNDLKQFTQYLTDKERLAVSKAQEQEANVNAIRAKATTGTGGGGAANNDAQVAIDNEEKKQASLKVLYDKGILNVTDYNQAILSSNQKEQQQELIQANAFAQAKANALGDSPEGFAEKQSLLKQQQDLQVAQATESAAAMGASAQQQAALQQTMRQKNYQSQIAAENQFNQQEIALATAHQKQVATLLGNSPAGFAAKEALAKQQFNMQLQQKKVQAQQEGLNQKQIDAMEESANQTHLADMKTMKEQWIEQDMAQNQTLGNNWQVSLDQIALSQEKFGVVMGTLRGVQQTEEYKGTMDGLNNLANLRNSHSKTAFDIGKKAAIASATVNTFLAATEAFSSLAGIPLVGPILGAAAAAAAIASGFTQIQQINSQQFGGQADSGMDSIPQALNGKSFTLSQGERIVQPTANADLTAFLAAQKSGGGFKSMGASGGGNQISITVNAPTGDASDITDAIVKQLRKLSSQGVPIMSPKGLTKS